MNRNEVIEFLREQSPAAFYGMPFNEPVEFDWSLVDGKFCRDGDASICESDVFGAESLQSRIETLLDMKFDTESTLLAAIGSLWGDNYRREVQELAAPHRIESDKGPLDTLKRLVSGSQQKTYWDGVEPLRVGHIVHGGEIVAVSEIEAVLEQPTGYAIYSRNSLKQHPFAKYTEQEREFLQAQVEAGVIKLC